ncbi:baseplate assembly protein [Vogesella indigofera]|uniref:baseplate assembly protein n=1 Tax=Vogesella indigofera TaxID=45465 RepID=UPI00234F0480|nr:baseplate J/gp47 family protein [Vogesella indigofera]MDC7699589.1 baseplate J/gp47 family protein [Vogesella indigofera]
MTVDLSKLEPPDLVEALDFDTLLAERKEALIALYPADEQDAIRLTLQLESEPLVRMLRENTYRELILRQRINEAARATMLAFATGADLDNRAADYGVERLLIASANLDAVPPVPAVWEDDDRLRYRCQLSLEGLTVAGSRGAYLFHTMTASANVLHAKVIRPEPGLIRVYIMDRRSNGTPDQALLDTVASYLSAEDRIPLCDTVEAAAGQPKAFAITAEIEFKDGALTAGGGLDAARLRLDAMLAEQRRLGESVPRSLIDATLHAADVKRVTLLLPAADIDCADGEFPDCTAITLSAAP